MLITNQIHTCCLAKFFAKQVHEIEPLGFIAWAQLDAIVRYMGNIAWAQLDAIVRYMGNIAWAQLDGIVRYMGNIACAQLDAIVRYMGNIAWAQLDGIVRYMGSIAWAQLDAIVRYMGNIAWAWFDAIDEYETACLRLPFHAYSCQSSYQSVIISTAFFCFIKHIIVDYAAMQFRIKLQNRSQNRRDEVLLYIIES